MFDDSNRLDLTSKDVELIEAALHTQQKILSLQSKAGSSGAREKLSDVKHLMKRVRHVSRRKAIDKPSAWSTFTRALFCPGGTCGDTR